MRNVLKITASIICLLSMSACGSKEADHSDALEAEADSESYSSAEVYNFTGNTMKEDYESCQNNPSAQFCPPLTGFNTYGGSGEPWLKKCDGGEAEEVCINRYLNIKKMKREERDNSVWIYTPTIKRYGDTYSFGMILGVVVEVRETEKIDAAGYEAQYINSPYPQASAYAAELAWADCGNRQINVVKSNRIKEKSYKFTDPENYIDKFEDLRSQKILKTYSVEGAGDIIPSNIDSTLRIDKPWREMLTMVCGTMTQPTVAPPENLPGVANWLMPDGTYADVRVDVNTLISNGSKRKFWFYVSTKGETRFENTASGSEQILKSRGSRVEVDCDSKTYKMIIDRTSISSSEWFSNAKVKPIEPKTLMYNLVYSPGPNAICAN
jgi:hypothetical protein